MATIKVNGISYFISSSKITTPSIKINGQGYIPLFSGNKNSTVDYNRYRYTLGELKVGGYRAAVSRSFINSAPTVSISANGSSVANGTNVTLTATGSDPDGDTLTYSWYRYDTKHSESSYIGSGSSITVSDSNKTWHYWCSVTDPYGATAYSNTRSVGWYNPNHASYITISNAPSSSSDGNINFTISYHDDDSDVCTVWYGYITVNGDRAVEHTVLSFHTNTSPSNTNMNATVNAQVSDGSYCIFARISDSNASDYSYRNITYVAPTTYAYKCTVECWQKEYTVTGYGSSKPRTWCVKVTANRYPSSCEGIYIFADIGDGTNWIYKSTEIEFYDNAKPSTIELTPYVTFPNTFIDNSGYKPVTVTKDDQKAVGNVKFAAVSFPDTAGETYKNTYTFEWN